MKYAPRSPPEGTWNVIRAWLADELRRVSNAIGSEESLQVTPIDAEPARPSRGMIVYALAVSWDPGAGEGLYCYNGSTWDRIN